MSRSALDPPENRTSSDRVPGGSEGSLLRPAAICPFLRSIDASWSSAHASRDLRCWAVEPPALPSPQKQRQACLTAAHSSCATFIAADEADQHLVGAASGDAGLWPEATVVPVAIEAVHARPGLSVSSPKLGGQALLVGVMVLAFLALVIARANPLAGAGASASSAPPATAVASAVIAASAEPTPSPAQSAEGSAAPASPSPSAPASATPAPSPTQRTYKVRSGDTVASIAAKFHTTVTAIVKANKIVDPRTIHPGQVLVIP